MTSPSSIQTTISQWDYLVCALYLFLSIYLGLKAGGKQKNLKDYLLAGHQMHWSLIAISILAALFSGISFLGAPAEIYGNNLVYLWGIVALWVATPITATIFIPFFFKKNLFTAYEYLEHRFSLRLRRITSAAFIFRGSLWLALAVYAPSLVISEMIGLPLWVSIVLAGAATLFYTTIGGMRAVIYTDVMQFTVFVVAMLIIMVVAIKSVPGGLAGVWEVAEAGGRTQFFDFTPSLNKRMTFWGAFFGGCIISLSGLITDQVSVQRYLTASSVKEARRALWGKLALSLPLLGMFYFAGLVLYSFYQTHPEMLATLSSADRVLPHFVSHRLSAPLPGLLVAAILAATMSTVSAGINSLTTATLMDFIYVGPHANEDEASERNRVRTARIWTVFFGVTTTLLALVVGRLGSLVEASNKIAGFLGGPMLGIFFLGVCSRRANGAGTLIGAISGFIAVLCVGFLTSVSFMWYACTGFVVTFIVGTLASLVFEAPDEKQQSFSLPGSRVPLPPTNVAVPASRTPEQ